MDDNSIAGATTAATWINGRSFINVNGTAVVFAVSPATGTATVTTAGTSSGPRIRLTVIKIS
jgi:hypothetical protein